MRDWLRESAGGGAGRGPGVRPTNSPARRSCRGIDGSHSFPQLNSGPDLVNIVRMTRTQFMALAASLPVAAQAQAEGRVFELRTYSTLPGRLPNLLARFRDHTTALFEKHGMTNVGYWTPAEGQAGAGSTLIYMLAHASADAAKKSWDGFRSDPAWIQARTESEKDGKIVDKVVSVMMQATDFSKMK